MMRDEETRREAWRAKTGPADEFTILSWTPVKIVGATKYPFSPTREPPSTHFAPSFLPFSMYPMIFLNWISSIWGPRSHAGENVSEIVSPWVRSVEASALTLATKASCGGGYGEVVREDVPSLDDLGDERRGPRREARAIGRLPHGTHTAPAHLRG